MYSTALMTENSMGISINAYTKSSLIIILIKSSYITHYATNKIVMHTPRT